jgi:uncharacterized membrane protein
MSNASKRYPIDIILFMIWSILLLPIVLLDLGDLFRLILGIPFLFFIPGYLLIFLLFPTKEEYNGIKTVERIGLSIGLSIALVSIVSLMLNFTPWRITLESVLFLLFLIVEIMGIFALYRWKMIDINMRFTISLDTSHMRYTTKTDKFLTILIFFTIFLAGASIIYIIATPKGGEPFTDFYVLPSNRNVIEFPQDILKGENTSVILGLINHEFKMMNYTIEVWLIDEIVIFNESTQKNETIYRHAWFMDEISVTLNHTEITNEKNKTKKWEQYYSFVIDRIGHFKLTFLLFTTPSEGYDPQQDYKNSIHQIMSNAYRNLHLWLYVG